MKIIHLAQSVPPVPIPAAGGPKPPIPMAVGPTPAAAGTAGAAASQPQDNSATSQMKRLMAMLGTLPIQSITTPQDKAMALQMAQQLQMVSSQLQQIGNRKGVSAPNPVAMSGMANAGH